MDRISSTRKAFREMISYDLNPGFTHIGESSKENFLMCNTLRFIDRCIEEPDVRGSIHVFNFDNENKLGNTSGLRSDIHYSKLDNKSFKTVDEFCNLILTRATKDSNCTSIYLHLVRCTGTEFNCFKAIEKLKAIIPSWVNVFVSVKNTGIINDKIAESAIVNICSYSVVPLFVSVDVLKTVKPTCVDNYHHTLVNEYAAVC